LLTLPKSWRIFWSPKIIKVDFEAAVISAINKVSPDSVTTGCNFHFNQCLWRIQIFVLMVGYKENEQVRLTRRMCCFGIPTYQESEGRLAYGHGKCCTELEINLISRLPYPEIDGEPE
jgi:hypothetical protein